MNSAEKKTRRPSRLVDVAIVLLLVTTIAIVSHFWISDRLGVKRAAYPVEAVLVHLSAGCSDGAPVWLESLMRFVIDDYYSPANQIAYIDPTGMLFHCESGWQRQMLFSPPVSASTRFRFASQTKLLTAAAIIKQINAGKLLLNTRLVDVLPELMGAADPRVEKITIAHLLNHSAGFDRLHRTEELTQRNANPWCPYQLLQLKKLSLAFEPGAQYVYSNTGYCLLGVVLERVTQQPYREVMESALHLSAHGLEFIDGPYKADEVRYDFRNSLEFGEDYYRYLDFAALSSSMGLSGNAVALAGLLRNALAEKPFNLVSQRPADKCDSTVYGRCFGSAVSYFVQPDSSLTLYLQGGYLYGAASLAFVDSRGGVFVWLGAGAPLDSSREAALMARQAYAFLTKNR